MDANKDIIKKLRKYHQSPDGLSLSVFGENSLRNSVKQIMEIRKSLGGVSDGKRKYPTPS